MALLSFSTRSDKKKSKINTSVNIIPAHFTDKQKAKFMIYRARTRLERMDEIRNLEAAKIKQMFVTKRNFEDQYVGGIHA